MAPKALSLFEARPEKGGFRSSDALGKDKPQAIADAASSTAASSNSGDGQSALKDDAGLLDEKQNEELNRRGSVIGFDAEDFATEETPLNDRLSFNLFVSGATLLNVLVIGLEQDAAPQEGELTDRLSWYLLECFFTFCFVIEIFLRIYHARGDIVDWIADLWNLADTLLVTAAAVETFILTWSGTGGVVRFFTVIRALRLIRLVRLARTHPYFRELWLLVGGLVNSLKALGWVGLIIVTVLYVCGIVVTTEIGQNHEVYAVGPSYDGELWPYEQYFGNVPTSMFSLLQVMTLDGWCDDIVRHVVHRQPLMGLFFVVFLFFTTFGLMNVVIGIIVENTLAAAQVADRRAEEHRAWNRKQAVDQLTDLLMRSDSRRTGEISLAELQVAHESAIVQELFKRIGLTMEEATNIFGLLDYERRGRVELKRFSSSCRELVGGAKRRDIAQVEITVGALARHLEQLDGQFNKIEAEVSNLTSMADDFVKGTVTTLTGFDGSRMPEHLHSH